MYFKVNGILLLLLIFPIIYSIYRLSKLREEKIRCEYYNLRHDLFIFAYKNNMLDNKEYKILREKIHCAIHNVHRVSMLGMIIFFVSLKLFFSEEEKKYFFEEGDFLNPNQHQNDFMEYKKRFQKIIFKTFLSPSVKIILVFTIMPIWFFIYVKELFTNNETHSQEQQRNTMNRWTRTLACSLVQP